MADTEKKLAEDLFQDFTDFQKIKEAGGSDAANKKVADELAHSIYDAVKNGSHIEFKGQKTAYEINGLDEASKSQGDIYLCTTSGKLKGETPILVKANTAVIWDVTSWCKFLELDLDGYATKDELSSETSERIAADATNSAATAAVSASLKSHSSNTNNPHSVTASQVGSYTKDETDSTFETKADAKSKAETYGIMMRSNGVNTLQFYRPELG